jgi:DUF1680 family protein
MAHSRRDALIILSASAAAAAMPWECMAAGAQRLPGPAKFFRLGDVRLGEGPFLRAQQLDADYLLRLDPDRMLANFRSNARLAPRAAVYGGWESQEPWVEIRCHGHTLGHFLTAASCMYQSTGDKRFSERVDYIVRELAECQENTGGWLTAFPDGVAPLRDSLAGQPFAGVPWYTTHKILAGLLDAHVQARDPRALGVLERFVNWIAAAANDVPDERFQKMLDREHGGMNELLANLHELTRNRSYQLLALRFSHRAVLEPLVRNEDRLDGLHSNTQIPKVIGFSRIHDVTGDQDYGAAARNFWDMVTRTRSFVTGGHGDGEHFFPKSEFAKHLGSAKTMETCCTHNMLRLTRTLFERQASTEFTDYYERALYNGILASQDPQSGMNTYFQATRPGYVRLYHTPFDSFWCCTGSGMENHARYGENIYALADRTVFVNLYIASTLEWREAGVTITQETRFPDSDITRLTVRCRDPDGIPLAFRQPAWCTKPSVRVNGRRLAASGEASGGYVRLPRPVRDGDVVEIQLPMKLALVALPNDPDYAALSYGPIVLAARLGTQGLTPGSQLIVNERRSGTMLDEKMEIPRWPKPLSQLVANTKRTSRDELRFTTRGFADGRSVELVPWFRLTNERYNLYWRSA